MLVIRPEKYIHVLALTNSYPIRHPLMIVVLLEGFIKINFLLVYV